MPQDRTTTELLAMLGADESVERLCSFVREGGTASAQGAYGSSTALVSAALARRNEFPVLLVVAHLDEADEAVDELGAFGVTVARFPALEVVPGETNVNLELLGERLRLVRRILEPEPADPPQVIAAPIQALMQAVPVAERLDAMQRTVRVGGTLDMSEMLAWLDAAGYARVDAVDAPGEFSTRGGIIDIFSPGGEAPHRIDLFGEEVETIWEIDLETMGSDRRVDRAEILTARPESIQSDEGTTGFVDLLPASTFAVLAELIEISEQGRGYYERVIDARGIRSQPAVFEALAKRLHAIIDINQFSQGAAGERSVVLPVSALPSFSEDTPEAFAELATLSASFQTTIFCQNEGEQARLRELLDEFAPKAMVKSQVTYLHRGFLWGSPGEPGALALVPYHELLNRFHARRRLRRISTGRALDTFLDIEPGDLVVHRDHGIARFVEFGPLRAKGETGKRTTTEEYLTLEFSGSAKLHVPASQIGVVQRYVGAFKGKPQLSILGGKRWRKQKEDVAEAVRDLAGEMLQIQAARAALPGVRYPADTAWQKEFEAEFPYEETEDQLAAIASVKRDMLLEKPMDRLICGDVGFGKTEVAIRAAFKAAEYGKQVAVLVPTTVLAEQHEITFRARFRDYPFRIESISRFKTKGEQRELLKEVAAGRVDIIIGTHRLLSKDVKFADLGLVVIDEEQRFGVEHKNRLLQFRMTADVLTMSATPIPRTLHMSLLGLRDISSLSTPPADRRSIVTEVVPYEKDRIRRAIERELAREGQVFFVHNRVYNIESVADDVRQLVPDARIVIGHGQMSPRELERVMLAFIRRQADILVCTTIIESGIDIPTANTMFINDADMFGLSELHQLRGRVGRYKHRAYCYLLLPDDRTMTEAAVRRLRAIEEYSMLGAGFKIAMRDLEIRGAGNLLGAEQSGHISAVGYELYCEMLQQAVADLKTKPEERAPIRPETTIDLGVTGALSKSYIPSDLRRLEAYRRIAEAPTHDELDRARHDLVTAYGDLPSSGETLFQLAQLRVLATSISIRTIRRHESDIIFRTADPRTLGERMKGAMGSLRLVGQPDEQGLTEVYYRPPKAYLEPKSLLRILERRLSGEAVEAVANARC